MLSCRIPQAKRLERQDADKWPPEQRRANEPQPSPRPIWSRHSCGGRRRGPIRLSASPPPWAQQPKEVPSRIKVDDDEHMWEQGQQELW